MPWGRSLLSTRQSIGPPCDGSVLELPNQRLLVRRRVRLVAQPSIKKAVKNEVLARNVIALAALRLGERLQGRQRTCSRSASTPCDTRSPTAWTWSHQQAPRPQVAAHDVARLRAPAHKARQGRRRSRRHREGAAWRGQRSE